MKKWQGSLHKKFSLLFISLLFFIWGKTYAAIPLPGSVDPGRVQKNYLPRQLPTPKAAPSLTRPAEEASPLGEEAKKIRFKLNKIILEGNHVYTDAEIKALYKDKLNTEISIAELQEIVQNITNYYRNNGYILSRAILPPQHVKNGTVKVKIIEGYIENVKILGKPYGAERIAYDYGKRITKSKPLQIKDMEYYLLLTNQLPGVDAKAILEPSKTQIGAADLNIAVETERLNSTLSYDNYGTLYIGPHQITGIGMVNSMIRSGDTTRLTYLTTSHGGQLHYLDLSYQTPIHDRGLSVTLGGNQSKTAPGFILAQTDTNGKSNAYYINARYPLILSRSEYLTADLDLDYLNSKTTQFDTILVYYDRLRPVRGGLTYSFSDKFNGSNLVMAHLEQGLNIWGASDDPHSETVSRFGADAIYTKIELMGSRVQSLGESPFALFFLAQGGYSNKPLLASEQFGFGGSQIGRGYDPAEILGDRGIAGSVEVRYNLFPEKFLFSSLQFYIFYDIGKVWNIKKLPDVDQNQSAASTGFGARFNFTPDLYGNVMFTQVLTKEIASEALRGRGRNPKTFFNLVATI